MFKNDERYWDINLLNKWFAISSVVFLVVMVWVFIDDNDDEFKEYQKEFRKLQIEITKEKLNEEQSLVDGKSEEYELELARAVKLFDDKSEEVKKINSELGELRAGFYKTNLKFKGEEQKNKETDLKKKEKELQIRSEEQNRKDVDLKVREDEQRQKELKETRRKRREQKLRDEKEQEKRNLEALRLKEWEEKFDREQKAREEQEKLKEEKLRMREKEICLPFCKGY